VSLMKQQTFESIVTFEQREKVPTQFGYSMRNVGSVTHKVVVIVDIDSIAKQLARKAYESKGKRASMGKGAIVVRPMSISPIK
jgi:hypothetical protein